MKRELFEAEKNYIKCAILMVLVGVGMILLGENNMGIGCIVIGVVFAIGAIYMIATNDKEPPKKEKTAKVKKENKDSQEKAGKEKK